MNLDLTDIELQASYNQSNINIAAMLLLEINNISEIPALEDTDSEYLSDLSSVILENQLENTSNINDDILLDAQLQQESFSNNNIDLAAEFAQYLI